MSWRKRKGESTPSARPEPTPPVSQETRRARAAATRAAIQLDQVRAQRAEVESRSRELDDLNRHSDFRALFRSLLGV